MSNLRARIEQRIADLRVERDIAAAATPGPWGVSGGAGDAEEWSIRAERLPEVADFATLRDALHIATQDPATTIARIDRELAGCAADLALLDEMPDDITGLAAINA